MVSKSWGRSLLLALPLASAVANAALDQVLAKGRPVIPRLAPPQRQIVDQQGAPVNLSTVYTFDQLIDHANPALGTFKQRYWTSNEYYKTGGPVVLMTPGETNADGYESMLTNVSVNGLIAQQNNGAVVVIEHRFFGQSNPYGNLTAQSLRYLTIAQAIDDLAHFAQTVDLPWAGGDAVKPDKTPWVLTGGSYAGALTSWTMVKKPDVFYAGWSSSGVVEAITDYYAYFTPILEHMPKNCSADVQAVVGYLDQLNSTSNATGIQTMQDTFGLGNLTHADDFALALTYNLADWQELQPDSGANQTFYRFCDALEVNAGGESAGEQGWGVEHAVQAWGSFWKAEYYNKTCGTADVETCLGTYNASAAQYTNTTVDNATRSWMWMVCNQVGYYQVGPPADQPAIVSRLVTVADQERTCVSYFPQAFPGGPPAPTVAQTNAEYMGWNVSVPRLFFANGLRDPWRGATVSADARGRGANANADTNTSSRWQPVYEGDGFHCSDLSVRNGAVDATVAGVQRAGLGYVRAWLGGFRASGGAAGDL
ncbi:peptidase S28 [Coniophora puteana RWD-64-598 SS2]|uniref:Peptidase S28 n=1 Tax=Coniophora puteana (strain RWD-64-598) TaxID=741705 RepID=R7SDV3_CONPW|nr:peptidase S28 [Coniophora puteana RWD-64-598 SS2]EIW74346.1 peptidase S28 [Coniophora puteana RWD-64-598 SS2]